MYRPEGWENPYFENVDPQDNIAMLNAIRESSIYEEGASAMLEGLKGNRIRSAPSGRIAEEIAKTHGNLGCKIVGYLVFIPEENR